MGAVYRAHDRVFDRVVAVKVIHPGQDANRFVVEAKVTACLQHPGIPSVYALGTLSDGRPFLAMKLIKGCTLETMLKARPDVSHEPGHYLAIFEQIAQGVAYAHAHRVIHRDLKPNNVMVGAFAEVQVMDWGLAKVLTDAAPSTAPVAEIETGPATHIRPTRDDTDGTRAGTALGTPAYMPPEQAIGAVEQIDTRSDVFGLGAILCHILTGRPPYIASDFESTRQLAARAKLDDAFARLDACGAEPSLIGLCKKCLSAERDDRPRNAGEVAKTVAELREDAEQRARQAELDRVRAEGERARAELETAELRKRRKTQFALLAALVVIAVGASGAAWWDGKRDEQQRSRQSEFDTQRIKVLEFEADQARQQIEAQITARKQQESQAKATLTARSVLVQLPDLYRRALWNEAEKFVAHALQSGAPDEDLRMEFERAEADIRLLKSLDEIRTKAGSVSDGGYQVWGGRAYAVVFRNRGYQFRGRADAKRQSEWVLRLQGDPIKEFLLAAIDDWILVEEDKPTLANLVEVAGKASGLSWRGVGVRFDDAGAPLGGFELALAVFNGQVEVPWNKMSPSAVASLGLLMIKVAPGSRDWALQKMEEALERHPSDFWLHLYIGQERLKQGRVDAAIGSFRTAVALRPEALFAKKLLENALKGRREID